MGLVKNENYIVIQGWMINDLHLSGNSLFVYAIIYSFSQDGESSFKGSLQYLADWCNATKQGIQKNLKELLDKGLISKQEHIVNNQKFCEYSCIPCNKVAYPMQQSCMNNIVLQEKLKEYLDLRLQIARSEGKNYFTNQWKGTLNELDKLTSDTSTMVKIVEQSIRNGWKGFYPLKENGKSTVKSHPSEKNVDTVKRSDEELDLVDEVY